MNTIRQLQMNNFRGFDFSSSPLSASKNRAVAGKNWINEFGVNKKRNGWEQILPKLGGKINGIFPYKTSGGFELLVFSGTKLYRVYKQSGVWKSQQNVRSVADRKITAVYGKHGIYYTSGSDLILYLTEDLGGYTSGTCLSLSGLATTASDAWANKGIIKIPKTTVGISPDGYPVTASSLDHPNLLTKFKINEFSGVDTSDYEYDQTNTENNYLYYSFDEEPGDIRSTALIKVSNQTVWNNNWNDFDDGNDPLSILYDSTTGKTKFKVRKGANWSSFTFSVVYPTTIDYFEDVNSGVSIHPSYYYLGQCTICDTFGIAGSADRLFLAGGYIKNRIYFSEEDDYTYFPYDYTADVGSSTTNVTSLFRIQDDTLAIFKEQNGNDPAIYYMTGRREYTYDDDGNIKKVTPVFSFTAGSTTETAVNPFVTKMLSGDSIITSKNGVFAIALTENYATNNRTARERSRLINAKLKNMDLSNAVSVVYKNKYYLAVGDEVFIADADFKYQPNDGEWWQYEWWHWDHVPVRCWAVVGDTLMFGTEDGRLCAFDDPDLYTDITYEQSASGAMTIEVSAGSSDTIIDDVVSSNLSALAYNPGTINAINGMRFRFVGEQSLEDDYYIFNASYSSENENYDFQLTEEYKGDNSIPINLSGVQQATVTGRFYTDTPVVAEWKTPVFDMGTNTHRKTLLRLTISTDNVIDGTAQFGYETRENLSAIAAKGIQPNGLFDLLDFTNFTVDKRFASSYTVRARERGFNYIQFYFKSESPTNCDVNSLTATYRIIAENKGVR